MKYLSAILLLTMIVCVGCQLKLAPTEDEAAQHEAEIMRYDRLEYRYLTTGDFSALQQMNTEFPMETRTLIENVLKIGEANDPNINRRLLNFYQDTTLQVIIADAEAKYADMTELNSQMKNAFSRLKEMVPGLRVPMIYAQLTSLDQSIVVGDHSVGISLDKYLGTSYALYQRYGFNEAQRSQMTEDFIVPDVITYYLISLYPLRDFESRPQHDRDLYMGKIQWVCNEAMQQQFFKNEHVNAVARFVKCNGTTAEELLQLNDYSRF